MKKDIKYICRRCGYTWNGHVETKYCPRCYRKDIEILKKENKVVKLLKEVRKNIKGYKDKIKELWEGEEKYIIKEYAEKIVAIIFLISAFIFIIYLLFNLLA